MTDAVRGPDLRLATDDGAARRVSEAVGLHEQPTWASRILTPEATEWLLARWNKDTSIFTWRDDDGVTKTSDKRRSLDLSKMSSSVALEVLVNIGRDFVDGNLANPAVAIQATRSLAVGGAKSLAHADPEMGSLLVQTLLRRWQRRLEYASADPHAEWDRDEVRMGVIRPGVRNSVLRLGEIEQPWLRDVVTDVLRVRLNSVIPTTLGQWALAGIRLSGVLALRPDRGMRADRLTGAAMDAVAEALRADPELSDAMVQYTMNNIGSILSQARALGFADRHRLSPRFVVRPEHLPRQRTKVREDRALPDATFRFLMGADEGYGFRVFDLARSIPGTDMAGDMFVVAVELAANFGRRPDELCRLPAARLRISDSGGAELLYDNFKSGRDHVWLPVDARGAELFEQWVARVRRAFPTTPLSELALLPRSQRNPRGTEPIHNHLLSLWFRIWVTLLEQSVVIGRLHAATGIHVDGLCALRLGSLIEAGLNVDGKTHRLESRDQQMLVDYAAEVKGRFGERKYAPEDPADIPLFPDPFVRTGGQQKSRSRHLEFAAVDPRRFDALGADWPILAAGYAAGGIPGLRLGESRISSESCQIRLFRHTYLQHLVNIQADIFLVQELADHQSVATTINSYVRVQDEKLREAIDALAVHRVSLLGQPIGRDRIPLASMPAKNIGTNECTNPKVLDLGTEGCEFDLMCFDCDHFAADPSNIPDIKAEIHTCNLTLARLEAANETALKPHHVAVLKHRRDGWYRILKMLQNHLDELSDEERERVLTAAQVVREFRDRVRSGGVNLGRTEEP